MSQALTREQLGASDPNQSVWVSASAGTGKTRVLVNRILRLLLAGTRPERILCITYTKAAAAEVIDRVQSIVTDWAVIDGRNLIAELHRVLDRVPNADEKAVARRLLPTILQTLGGMRIMTIHAFCQSVLSRFPLEAQINPGFHIMDDIESLALLDQAKQAMLSDASASVETVAALDFLYGHVSEENQNTLLQNVLQKRYRLSRFFRHFDNNLHKVKQYIYNRFDLAPTQTLAEAERAFIAATQVDAVDLALDEMIAKGSPTTVERAHKIRQWLKAEHKNLADYMRLFFTQEGKINSKLLTGIKIPSEQLQAMIDHEITRLQEFQKLQSALVLAQSSFSLMAVSFDILTHYNDLKNENSLLDYEDQILLTVRLLTELSNSQWVLYKLDGGIDHILLDEAQDTSPAQWDIIAALAEEFFAGKGRTEANERTIFIVGDEKQSIFSFQNADPAEFARMRETLAGMARQGRAEWDDIALIENFRSSQLILDFTDTVFNHNQLTPYLSERERSIRHEAFHKEKSGRIEIWPLVVAPETEQPSLTQQPEFILAQQIADHVQNLLQDKTVKPGDIMILVRKRHPMVVPITKALKDRNIAVSGADRMVLRDQLAVQDFLSALQVGFNPYDDYNFACFLKSPLIGLDEDALFALCHDRPGSVWERLYADDHQPIIDYCRRLAKWVQFNTPSEVLQLIANNACPASNISGRHAIISRMGLEADDLFTELLDAARSFESLHPPSTRNFLSWIQHSDAAVKKHSAERDENRVRIMTVHASKGLQSRIVILADPTTKPESYRSNRDVIWDSDINQGFLWSAGAGRNHPAFQVAKEEFTNAVFGEYYRLLYVAITRAEEQLIVCGWQTKKETHRDYLNWYQVLASAAQNMTQDKSYQTTQKDKIEILYKTNQGKEKQDGTKLPIAVPIPNDLRIAPPDESFATRPLRPSDPMAQEPAAISPLTEKQNNNFRRGQIIHRILSVVPDQEAAQQEIYLERFLAREPDLSTEEKEQITQEIRSILHDPRFQHLFTPQARSEVPVVGEIKIDGQDFAVSGQIDRLLVEADRVVILDYKTNRPAALNEAEVPEVYRKQLRAYKLLLEKIYPDKKIETVLLWTSVPYLLPLSV